MSDIPRYKVTSNIVRNLFGTTVGSTVERYESDNGQYMLVVDVEPELTRLREEVTRLQDTVNNLQAKKRKKKGYVTAEEVIGKRCPNYNEDNIEYETKISGVYKRCKDG